ncbi:hypothetical protein MKX01_028825 [Papaver californicum]|nr:hypothetical protein MKX01_028825 [Papaver californicum]
MDFESVGSNTPILESYKQQENAPRNVTLNGDTCYHCHKPGHWANRCPDRQMNVRDPPNLPQRNFFDDQSSIPARQCRCGGGTCIVRTSHTESNPDRKFYTCPGKKDMKCNFFQWCDEAKPEDFNEVPLSPYPKCPCGAGLCHRYTNRGRPYFRCPIKPGEGACGFKQWQETPTKAVSSDLVNDNIHSPKLAYAGQEETKRANDEYRIGDGSKLKEIVSHVLPKYGSESPLIKVSQVKEDTVRLDSMADDKIISLISTLKLSDEKITTTDAKTWQCSSESSYPMCRCGAGKCSRRTESTGQNYFVCPVKKGEGACNFRQLDVQGTIRKDEHEHADGDKLKARVASTSSMKKESNSNLTREHHVKDDKVNVSFPVRYLMSNKEKVAVPNNKAVSCLWCGSDEHFLKDCITSNPPCFRCGEFGHWMKDCIA